MQLELLYILLGIGLATIFLTLYLFWQAHFFVEEGHLAVLTRFGKLVRNHSTTNETVAISTIDFIDSDKITLFKPGAHWKFPWDKVLTFSTMERVIDLSGETSGKYAMACDGTVLRLDSKIRFAPKLNDLYSYLFELKNPMGHIREMFTCIIRNEIANFNSNQNNSKEDLGSYSHIRRNRQVLNEQVEYICRDQIGVSYGIQFMGVDLIDIIPPHELEEALNGIQNAKIEADTLYARAEADSKQKIIGAEQGVEIAKFKAESVAMELQTLAKSIKRLIDEGQINDYLLHRRTELLGDSKMLFMQKEF
jgi:regulator of protease activity HflC (stomatin/prohibitin superfamily)